MGTFRQLQIEQKILNDLRVGKESALDILLRKHGQKLLYFAKSIVKKQEVAEEIVADSMVKLWEQRETFETADNVNAFLYIVVKNLGINYIKSSYASRQYDYEVMDSLESLDPGIYVNIVRAELLQSIHDEVGRLPEKQREVFRLTYFEELGTEEICERLGISAAAVFTNRSRAIENLKMVFKANDMDYCFALLCVMVSQYHHKLPVLDSFFN